jgi:hypothetical protein
VPLVFAGILVESILKNIVTKRLDHHLPLLRLLVHVELSLLVDLDASLILCVEHGSVSDVNHHSPRLTLLMNLVFVLETHQETWSTAHPWVFFLTAC